VKLEDLGFSAAEADALAEGGWDRAACARVIRAERGQVATLGEMGERVSVVPGSLKAGEGAPTTGDWVVLSDRGAVLRVLPRRTRFVRRAAGLRTEAQVVASNVDVAFVLTGLDGDFNPRRIERYLTLVAESGARPVVLLTKAAACADREARLTQARDVAPGADVHAIDVVDGIEADAPRAYLAAGVTAAVLGSSGVGKSTLVNHLMGQNVAKTKEVREHDDRGKHTTSRRELHLLPGGGAIIDTPGMRELSIWGDASSLRAAFPDVVDLEAACRFRDCRHAREPGCAVRAAVERGLLAEQRLESYQGLLAEIEATERARVEKSRRRRDR
jgi:ribosome biogenesis GTPase